MCSGKTEVKETIGGFVCPDCNQKLNPHAVLAKLLGRINELETQVWKQNGVFADLGYDQCSTCGEYHKLHLMLTDGQERFYCMDCLDNEGLPILEDTDYEPTEEDHKRNLLFLYKHTRRDHQPSDPTNSELRGLHCYYFTPNGRSWKIRDEFKKLFARVTAAF